MYRVGKELFPLSLAEAQEKHVAGKAEKLKLVFVTAESGMRYELPLYREIIWHSSSFSSRMSPPIPVRKRILKVGEKARRHKIKTYRKAGNSAYSRHLDSCSSHTCSDKSVRPCVACTLEFLDQPYPIRRTNVSVTGLNGPVTTFSAVGGHVIEKKVKVKKVGGTETDIQEITTTEWDAPEKDPRVRLDSESTGAIL